MNAPAVVARLLENDELDWTPDPTDPDDSTALASTPATFGHDEKVAVLPNPHMPGKRVRYGHVAGYVITTDKKHPDDPMYGRVWIAAEDRWSEPGERAYMVYFSPGGGGVWWSDKYLRKVKSRLNR